MAHSTRPTRTPLRSPALLFTIALLWSPAFASAQITQPDGNVYPVDSANGEIQLFTLFSNRGEAVDWQNDAAQEPNTFSPLCDFTAELLLKESGSQLNVGWYNADGAAPADSEIYPIFPGPLTGAGAIVTGATIRDDPNYEGGQIGFALIRGGGSFYFTESQYNPVCNAGPCDDGSPAYVGNWIMSLSYQSTVAPNAFYVAFEDGNADDDGWNNDGDYNDYVFLFTGITCEGAGETCDVPGQEGICAIGLLECDGAGLTCRQVNSVMTETCDGLDNDCDGSVDNGDLCPGNQVCTAGTCVGRCSEFGCAGGDVCDMATDLCLDPLCQGVSCPSGEVCRDGACGGPCDGVVCPGALQCRFGACIDPCEGVTCTDDRVCEGGVCVESCSCSGCTGGLSCDDAVGLCRDTMCVGVTCTTGTTCDPSDGMCVDACQGAVCPDDQVCVSGACEPAPPTDADMGTTMDMGGTGDGGAGGDSGTGTGGDSGTGGIDQGTRRAVSGSSCGCSVPAQAPSPSPWLLAFVVGAAVARRRRRQPGRRGHHGHHGHRGRRDHRERR